MKIAYLVGKFPTLSETFILNQITGLAEKKCKIDIYGYMPEDFSKVHPDVNKYSLDKSTFYYEKIPKNYFLRLLKAFRLIVMNFSKAPLILCKSLNFIKFGHYALSLRLLFAAIPFLDRDTTYDIIHCHFGHNGILGMRLKGIGALQGKLIVTFHALDITRKVIEMGDDLYNELFLESDLLLPISKNWERRLIKLGCDSKKILVHHMGIDCRKFDYIPRQISKHERVNIITVARLVEKKGVEYGIRAISVLKSNGYSVKYSIIGNGELYNELYQLAIDLGLKEVVHLLGWMQQEELLDIMNSAHILLAPSITSAYGDQEGIPVAIMEALAMGLPVVSTYHSGIPELVDDGLSGYLVPERDTEALAERLAVLIDDTNSWSEMGQAGRNKVMKEFNVEILNSNLHNIFQNM